MEDPSIKHPSYLRFAPSWELMRDAVAGEDDVKAKGTRYLPMKTGTSVIEDQALKGRVYDLYKTRAEFPEVTAPTIRGAVGIMLGKPAKIELPPELEHLRERATLDGLTLDALHRRMGMEVMTTGRYGLLPGLMEDGTPYLSGYVAESITNWDSTGGVPDYVVLDESGPVRDRATGLWTRLNKLRQCMAFDGPYRARVWEQSTGGAWAAGEEVAAATPRGQPLDFLPFVFVGSLDLTPDPDDVPLYGLAKLAVRIYRLDADFSFSLHMTSEPTPVAIGFDDPKQAIDDGIAPKTLGSSVLWILPKDGDAKYLEFSGPGLEKQADAIQEALGRAAQFGAQVIQSGQSAESGEALKLRAASQTATLTSIAQTTAAGLERALRNTAIWVGADPEKVIVTPNLEFFDRSITAQEIQALVAAWQAGAMSHKALFDRLQQGGVIHEDRSYEDEGKDILNEGVGLDPLVSPGSQIPGAEGAIN
ncbi:DUF4055 domain-containing protein [Comamonas sp. Y6]|uniref:DUF4055 domain-containing protein n=1 Tax=Comamonas resistens TaxID=3046670 RepID=A0ABY8SXZ7_9BURK|nr:DUF4055 domain-containing protein [Comamonas resistens]MDL5036839.1 DUF4055 domain-containing protein [Comamonas resistens]WHS67149.1 DUF4055 domain-containing protein [Comamonas resistens]